MALLLHQCGCKQQVCGISHAPQRLAEGSEALGDCAGGERGEASPAPGEIRRSPRAQEHQRLRRGKPSNTSASRAHVSRKAAPVIVLVLSISRCRACRPESLPCSRRGGGPWKDYTAHAHTECQRQGKGEGEPHRLGSGMARIPS